MAANDNGRKKRVRGEERRVWNAPAPSRQARRELKEEVLYETAARWFNKHGFHGTSLADLGSELGITKAALYYYVSDKSELLYRLHVRSLRAARGARDKAVEEGRDGLDRVRLLIFHYVSAMTASPIETFILLEDGALPAEQAQEIIKGRRWLERDLRGLIRKGIDDGSIVPCDPKLVAVMIVGAMAWVSKWYHPEGAWEGPQIAEAMSALVERMLGRRRQAALAADVSAIGRERRGMAAHPRSLSYRGRRTSGKVI
jgi:TetR/AcrR family transcriptional regulator